MDNPSARYVAADVTSFAENALRTTGLSPADTVAVVESLVAADLRGVETHGLVRLPSYFRNLRTGLVDPHAAPVVAREGPTTAVIDAQNGMGQVAGVRAMEMAIEKAAQLGMGSVTVRASNHFGACAHYALMAATRGMIGIAMTNGSPAMAPWGGIVSTVGNNPIAIASPSGGAFSLVLDMALTVVARGRIKLAQLQGKPIPPGWAIDKFGQPTTNADVALDGTLLPVGGYKGYGLAVMVDLLTAVLSGAALSPELENMGFTVGSSHGSDRKAASGTGTGHWFLALNINAFLPEADFASRVAAYAAGLKQVNKAEGVSEIYLPGELEARSEADRRLNGIPYDPTTIDVLRQFALAEGLAFPAPSTA